MPEKMLPYLKAWAALLFAVLTVVVQTVPLDGDAKTTWTAVVAVLGVLAVYGVPNKDTEKPAEPTV